MVGQPDRGFHGQNMKVQTANVSRCLKGANFWIVISVVRLKNDPFSV